jgi:hypothetical protein
MCDLGVKRRVMADGMAECLGLPVEVSLNKGEAGVSYRQWVLA